MADLLDRNAPDSSTSSAPLSWSTAHSVWLFLLLVALPAVGLSASYAGNARMTWLACFVLILAIVMLIGHGTTQPRRWRGILIDDRNVMSLSRFQMVTWTVIVLSAFFAAGIWNISVGYIEPLRIAMPSELWLLMGISTTSLVASPLILSNKKALTPSNDEKNRVFLELKKVGDSEAALDTNGVLVTNRDIETARWSDMLTGEETGNAARADLSRIQMFFFTLVVAFTYLVALWAMFGELGGEQGVEAFPSLDESILALIGISHAGYLTSKAVPHSKAASPA